MIDKDIEEPLLNLGKLARLPLVGRFFEKRPKVAVLRLAGVIADSSMRRQGLSHQKFSKLIDKAFDKADKAVALVINSPGGAPAQSSLIASHIRRRAEETELPVYAFVEDVAASGGYWLACAADEIYAQETSIVGSIGVISSGFGFEDFIERYGIKRRVHTAGKNKSFLDPFVPEKESDVKRLLALQKDMHKAFVAWVKDRRGKRLKGTDKVLFDGEFWLAGAAMEKGLIDDVGDLHSVMQDKFGEKVNLIPLSAEKKLSIPFITSKIEGLEAALDTLDNRSVWSRYGL